MNYKQNMCDLISVAAQRGLVISLENDKYYTVANNKNKCSLETSDIAQAIGKILRMKQRV